MGIRILVADDSLTIRKVVELALQNQGFEILAAETGEEAFQKIQEFPPDFIIADTRMPGISGLELCQKIREAESLQQIPILLLSSNFEEFVWEEAQAAGATSYLTKPFEARQLLEKVKEYLPPGLGIPEPTLEESTGESSLPPSGELGPQWVETVREAIDTQVREIATKHIREMAERRMAELEPEIRKIIESVIQEAVPRLAEEILREAIDTQVREIAANHIGEVMEKHLREIEPETLKIIENVVREEVPRLAEEIIRQEIEKIKTGTD